MTPDPQIEELKRENEQLRNRVNLLSASANRIRDAYDNGLNAELKEEIASLKARVIQLEGALIELKHLSHHTIEEEMWRIDAALSALRKDGLIQ